MNSHHIQLDTASIIKPGENTEWTWMWKTQVWTQLETWSGHGREPGT